MRVRYATSLTTLARQHAAGAGRTQPEAITAALLAAPEIPPAIRTQLTLAQTGWKAPDEEATLTRTTSFAHAYGDTMAATARADASEQAARAAIAAADVVHLAGPFQASAATPLFSVVVLSASGEGADADGRWELREWFHGDAALARARVMVLTDGGSLGTGGTGGALDALAWASAALGVPSLVVARWPADGFKSDELLLALHRGLANGASVGEAWAAAVSAAAATSRAPQGWTGLRLLGPG
jgi:hypothetical protein